MIKIQVLCPFRYQFNSKDIWLMAGDYYHLDIEKDELELKHILSPHFTFKEYIYVHKESIPESFLKEMGAEYAGPEVPAYEPPIQLTPPAIINEDVESSPIAEPTPNYFADQIESAKLVAPIEPKVEEIVVEEEVIVETDVNTVLEARRAELDELHWRKLKDVAELYEIEYTEKDEVIEAILAKEFN